MLDHSHSIRKVITYFNTAESRWGYTLLLKGTKHFGFYPEGQEHISMASAQALMEARLAEKLSLPRDSLVFDAGSGEGNVAIHLAEEYGYQVRGVDLLEFAVRRAQHKAATLELGSRVRFQVGDYTHVDFADETFDGVYTMETLVHVPDYRTALKEFYRVLKPGGKLVLFEYSIPPKESFTPRQSQIADIVIEESGMHSLPYFLHDTFPEILRQAGFTNIHVENITPRVVPMLRKLYLIAYLPYQLINLFRLQRRFVNATSAVEGYKNLQEGDYWRYNIVTAVKDG